MSPTGMWKAGAMMSGVGLLLATALTVASGTRPPDGIVLPQAADSPGRVLFNHTTHVDNARPDCTACHPRPFSILPAQQRRIVERRSPTRVVIVHARMEKGEYCGSCHNGKKAFALEDDCAACHQP